MEGGCSLQVRLLCNSKCSAIPEAFGICRELQTTNQSLENMENSPWSTNGRKGLQFGMHHGFKVETEGLLTSLFLFQVPKNSPETPRPIEDSSLRSKIRSEGLSPVI
jgi:hypothetical protein